MNIGDPDRPAHEPAPGGFEYPADYPVYPDNRSAAGLPPPIYPPPPPGYQGAPAYYPAYDPYLAVKPAGTNGNAIAALVSSIAGLLCCGLLGVVGLIFGVIGMRETKRTGQAGYGLALAGAIIGGLTLAGTLIVLGLYVILMFSGWQWT